MTCQETRPLSSGAEIRLATVAIEPAGCGHEAGLSRC